MFCPNRRGVISWQMDCLFEYFLPHKCQERKTGEEILHQSPHRDPDRDLSIHVEWLEFETCELWKYSTCNKDRKQILIQAHRPHESVCSNDNKVNIIVLDYMLMCTKVAITGYQHKYRQQTSSVPIFLRYSNLVYRHGWNCTQLPCSKPISPSATFF